MPQQSDMRCRHCSKGKRKRWTWRKWVLAAFLLLLIAGVETSYVFTGFGLDANAEVTCELIKVFGAALVGYFIADTGDHYSENRYGRKQEDAE